MYNLTVVLIRRILRSYFCPQENDFRQGMNVGIKILLASFKSTFPVTSDNFTMYKHGAKPVIICFKIPYDYYNTFKNCPEKIISPVPKKNIPQNVMCSSVYQGQKMDST